MTAMGAYVLHMTAMGAYVWLMDAPTRYALMEFAVCYLPNAHSKSAASRALMVAALPQV